MKKILIIIGILIFINILIITISKAFANDIGNDIGYSEIQKGNILTTK